MDTRVALDIAKILDKYLSNEIINDEYLKRHYNAFIDKYSIYIDDQEFETLGYSRPINIKYKVALVNTNARDIKTIIKKSNDWMVVIAPWHLETFVYQKSHGDYPDFEDYQQGYFTNIRPSLVNAVLNVLDFFNFQNELYINSFEYISPRIKTQEIKNIVNLFVPEENVIHLWKEATKSMLSLCEYRDETIKINKPCIYIK